MFIVYLCKINSRFRTVTHRSRNDFRYNFTRVYYFVRSLVEAVEQTLQNCHFCSICFPPKYWSKSSWERDHLDRTETLLVDFEAFLAWYTEASIVSRWYADRDKRNKTFKISAFFFIIVFLVLLKNNKSPLLCQTARTHIHDLTVKIVVWNSLKRAIKRQSENDCNMRYFKYTYICRRSKAKK